MFTDKADVRGLHTDYYKLAGTPKPTRSLHARVAYSCTLWDALRALFALLALLALVPLVDLLLLRLFVFSARRGLLAVAAAVAAAVGGAAAGAAAAGRAVGGEQR